MNRCQHIEYSKEILFECKKFDYDMFIDSILHEQFSKTLEILRELEDVEAKSLKMNYNYLITGLQEFREEADDVCREYRSGMMDPCRDVALVEKQAFVKKNVGKKAATNKY